MLLEMESMKKDVVSMIMNYERIYEWTTLNCILLLDQCKKVNRIDKTSEFGKYSDRKGKRTISRSYNV